MPRVVDIASRRAALAAASLEVIASEGLTGATLRRIAEHMGVSTGSITHYFNGREELLVEAVASAHLAAGRRMQAAVEALSSPAERLEAVVLEALPLDEVRLREWKVWSAFRGALPDNSAMSAGNDLGYGAWNGFLRTLLEPLFADAEDVRRQSALIMALVDGIGFRLAALPNDSKTLTAEQHQVAGDVRAYLKDVVARGSKGAAR